MNLLLLDVMVFGKDMKKTVKNYWTKFDLKDFKEKNLKTCWVIFWMDSCHPILKKS